MLERDKERTMRGSQDLNLQPLPPPEQRIKVVLCQPDGSRNVGSACRAIASMGYTKLHIVGRPASFFDRGQVGAMATSSAHLFDAAQFHPNLDPVVHDCSLVVGLTRRRGSRRKYFSITPEQLRERIQTNPGNIALLFGNERIGLCDEELNYANLACHIPTHPQQPSLNLAQAVQIILYELSKIQEHSSGLMPLKQSELTELSAQLNQDMCAMGLADRLGNQRTETFLCDILSRAALSKREAERLQRIFQTLRYNQSLRKEKEQS